MEQNINWQEFNGTKFQKFCNGLLVHEITKNVQVYSKDGKDRGIDQYYFGTYQENVGSWRFQDKFHNTNPKQDFSSLKKDVKGDIDEHLKEEDIIVYLTNVNLLPQQEEELLEVAQKAIIKKTNRDIVVKIWHHAWIESILPSHPLIYNWFWGNEQVLMEYQTFFAAHLKNTGYFSNDFIGRNKDLERLEQFINDEKQTTFALVGNGGLGKTRLCVHFFKTIIDSNSDWTPVCLNIRGNIQQSDLQRVIKGKKKLIILVDDAHNNPNLLATVHQIALQNQGKIKVVFTVRTSLYEHTISSFSTHEFDFPCCNLKKLNYDETESLFKKLLPENFGYLVSELSRKSSGYPALIVEYAKTIKAGRNPFAITEEENFITEVKKHVKQVIENIDYLDKVKIKRIIDFLSLVCPISSYETYNNTLADLVDINEVDWIDIINLLKKEQFLTLGRTLSIQPDPYSDAILGQAIKNEAWLKSVLSKPQIMSFLDTILLNLAKAELNNSAINSVTNETLIKYIEQIDTIDSSNFENTDFYSLTNIYKFGNTLQTISYIADIKPHIALFTAQKFFERYKDLHDASRIINNFEQLVNVAIFNYPDKSYLESFYKLLVEYTQISNNFNLIIDAFCYKYGKHQALSYRMYHYRTSEKRNCSERPLFIAQKVIYILQDKNADEFLQNFSLRLSKGLLNANYTYICEHTITMRKTIIDSLIAYYSNTTTPLCFKREAIKILLNTLYDARIEKLTQETNFIFDYFERLSQDSSLLDTIVRREIGIFFSPKNFRGRKDKANKIYEQIMFAKTLKEKLQIYLYWGGNITSDKFIDIVEEYLQQDSITLFYDDVLSFCKNLEQSHDTHLSNLLNVIAFNYPQKAKELYDYVSNIHPSLNVNYFYLLLRGNYTDESYFYSELDKLNQSNSDVATRKIIWLLTAGRNNNYALFRERDFALIEDAVNKGHLNTNDCYLITSLFYYAFVNVDKTFNLINSIIKHSEEEVSIHIFDALFEEPTCIFNHFPKHTKELFVQISNKIDHSSYGISKIYNFIENFFGFDELLIYLEKQQLFKQNDLFVTNDKYRNTVTNQTLANQRFAKVVVWYLNYPHSQYNMYNNQRNLLSFFMPQNQIDDNLAGLLNDIIDQHKDCHEILKRFYQVLAIWEHKNANLLNLLFKITNLIASSFSAIKLYPEFDQVLSDTNKVILYGGSSKNRYTQKIAFVESLFKRPDATPIIIELLEYSKKSLESWLISSEDRDIANDDEEE